MYVKLVNGQVASYPYFLESLRVDFPRVSFPREELITDEILSSFGVYPVKPTSPPDIDQLTHTVVEEIPVIENGEYKQSWSIKQKSLSYAIQEAKKIRDKLLISSDWTQLSDAPVDKQAWLIYRQQLRDLPQQEGFPFSIEWPEPPQ